MGPGKAELLDAIAETGSISAAARMLGMSYRRGWMLVDTMNRCFAETLVEARPGGGKNAGAQLTDQGRQVLANYKALCAQLGETAKADQLSALEAQLREEPLPQMH